MTTSFEILLAEDDSDDVFLMQRAFKQAGVASRLHVVSDGPEVLVYLMGQGKFGDRAAYPFPHILLLDLSLPRLDGFQVLARLRGDSQFHRLIVHVFTNSSRDEDAARARDLGASSYVLKPSNIDKLAEFVTALHYWHQFVVLPK